jgi:hypothetical protein
VLAKHLEKFGKNLVKSDVNYLAVPSLKLPFESLSSSPHSFSRDAIVTRSRIHPKKKKPTKSGPSQQ